MSIGLCLQKLVKQQWKYITFYGRLSGYLPLNRKSAMFSKKNKTESVSEKRNRVMAEIYNQMLLRKESAAALLKAEVQKDDWFKRLKLVEIRLRTSPQSETLQFLRSQALLNHEIAKEEYESKRTRHQKMVELTDGATEALESLERIALAEATREALQNHRNTKLSGDSNSVPEDILIASKREIDRAEHYAKALTELSLEDTK